MTGARQPILLGIAGYTWIPSPGIPKGTPCKTIVDRLRNTLSPLMTLVGHAPRFVEAVQALPLMAKSEGTVLIRGETGTGKELAARAVHYLSPRRRSLRRRQLRFVAGYLARRWLFGHERGSFTDARERRGDARPGGRRDVVSR